MDRNSAKNQRICGKLVQRDVIACVSTLVSELAAKAEHFPEYEDDLYRAFSADDWEQGAADAVDGMDAESLREYLEENDVEQIPEGEEDMRRAVLDHIGTDAREFCENNRLAVPSRDVLEHWIVTDWLADCLENRGELIIRDFFGFDAIWGRTCSGQAILLDGVIWDICESMEILEGQRNEWEV